jgi:peptide/nickel transport system ATP-binding protein
MSGPLVVAENVVRRYPLRRAGLFRPSAWLTAVDGVSFSLARGRSLGVVGESGSGKSTLARLVMALEKPDAGRILFDGEDLNALPAAGLRARRRQFQMVFQDPFGSLDPRMTVANIVAEPLEVAEPDLDAGERLARVRQILASVALPAEAVERYPHEFSGGQRQRIALARALITEPALVVADEPVSALDVSVQAQVLNLMADLRDERGLTYLFISHNLAVIEHVADDVIVLYRGRIVEQGAAADLFDRPSHPYTRALVDAVPGVEPEAGRERLVLRDEVARPPSGACAFSARCPFAQERCGKEAPALRNVGAGRMAACHFPL